MAVLLGVKLRQATTADLYNKARTVRGNHPTGVPRGGGGTATRGVDQIAAETHKQLPVQDNLHTVAGVLLI